MHGRQPILCSQANPPRVGFVLMSSLSPEGVLLMARLGFVIPGFSKCGTTSLCRLLSQHPRIRIPLKEPGYFAQNHGQGWAWYASLYRDVPADAIAGDASTTYATEQFGRIAASRMAGLYPELKYIFIARHPLRRLESSYRQMHHTGHLFGVAAHPDIGETLRQLPNMVDDTRYWRLLNLYRRHVSDDRILVLFLEDFAAQPEVETRRCFRFLGLEPDVPLAGCDQRSNPGSSREYDTAVMRFIRRHDLTRGLWNRLAKQDRSRLALLLWLRRQFRDPVAWPAEAVQRVRNELFYDSRAFLEFCGRPASFWAWPGVGVAAAS